MQNAIKSALFKAMLGTALGAAIFGSFRFAQARILTHGSAKEVMALPKELGEWKTFESSFDVTKSEVVARKYINKQNRSVGVVVRTSTSNAVLHDLTSCLINADAKTTIEDDQHIPIGIKTLDASLVSFKLKNGPRRALLWFQSGAQTASNRWGWRLISTTSEAVREAPFYYQVEVATEATNDKTADLGHLKEMAVLVFNQLVKH